MVKKVPKKKRCKVPSPDQVSSFRKPVTRGDTIGLRLGNHEPGNIAPQQNEIRKILVGHPNQGRVLTREIMEFLDNETQILVESEDGNGNFSHYDFNSSNCASIQEAKSQNFPTSHNSSLQNLNSFEGHGFQEICISKLDSPVNEERYDFPDPQNQMNGCISETKMSMQNTDSESLVRANCSSFKSLSSLTTNPNQDMNSFWPHSAVPNFAVSPDIENQITELSEGSNINTCVPKSEKEVKANDSSFQSSSPVDSNTYQDTCISNLDSSFFKEQFNAQDVVSKVCNGNLSERINISIQNPDSEKAVKSEGTYLQRSKIIGGQNCKDTSIVNQEFRIQEELPDSQEQGKSITEDEKGVIYSLENPNSENVQISSNIKILTSLNDNRYQDIYTTLPQVQAHMQQVDRNEQGKQINEHEKGHNSGMNTSEMDNLLRSNNIYHDNSNFFNVNSPQDKYTSQPQAQFYNQQIQTQSSENLKLELAKGFSLNTFIENAIDSVAAVLLPYVP